MRNISLSKYDIVKPLIILNSLPILIFIVFASPVLAETQTAETEQLIKWDFRDLVAHCNLNVFIFPASIASVTGRFETDVDLSSDATARKYIKQAIDTALAVSSCRSTFKRRPRGGFRITLYSLKNKILVQAVYDLESKNITEYRNLVVEAIELSEAQKKADEEIDRLIKSIDPLDWKIDLYPSASGKMAKMTIRFKAAVDLSDDAIVKRYLSIARDIALKKSSPLKTKTVPTSVEIELHSLKGREYYVSAYYDDTGALRYNNHASEYAKKIEKELAIGKATIDWLDDFINSTGVEVLLGTYEMRKRLSANPFQWKGKVVGFEAEFGGMLSESSGIFDLLIGPPALIVVKKLPSTTFTKSGEKWLLAGRVQGMAQVQIPFVGNTSVPELSFVGAKPYRTFTSP